MISKLAWLTILSLSISACSSTRKLTEDTAPGYKMTITQGNEITKEAVDKLRIGMSKEEVKAILGEPQLENPFRDDTWYYPYNVIKADKVLKKSNLVLHFTNNKLARASGKPIEHNYLDKRK